MRGKRGNLGRQDLRRGLIPAHAGKTPVYFRCTTTQRAHPRACGENRHSRRLRLLLLGSSPRMRGKLGGLLASGRPPRLIPAHAGKTERAFSVLSREWAHPRACGENLFVDGDGVCLEGSSPRMRGKRRGEHRASVADRLIPAHAGKTAPTNTRRRARWAHPRACGENVRRDVERQGDVGSSPRMRGKPMFLATWLMLIGLIPAHAGKTP